MNTKLIAGGTLAGLILAGGLLGSVTAQTAAEATGEATGLTEAQVIEIALAEVPGEVTEVELEQRRGKSFYEIEVTATDGTETEMKINAETGEIMNARGEGKNCGKHKGDKAQDA